MPLSRWWERGAAPGDALIGVFRSRKAHLPHHPR
jgi:hypothetical protein